MADISVIVPCYNCADWIDKCLFALNKQTYQEFEVICVDDCSSDNTYDALCQIKEQVNYSMIIIQNKRNSGPAFSRNVGMECANGQYLAFCDSDDWYEESFLEEMRTEISAGHDLVMCEYRKVFDSGKNSVDVHYLSGCKKVKMELIAYSKAAMPLLLFDKRIVGSLKVPNLRNGEDIAFIPCIESRAKSIGFVNKPLYNYRMRAGSSSKTPNPDIYQSLKKAFEFIECNGVDIGNDVLEYIGIKTVMYGATINAFKAGISTIDIKDIIMSFESKYPGWRNNRYMFLFSKPKRLYLFALRNGHMLGCRFLARIHQKLSL